MSRKRISIVTPVFNNAPSLVELYRRIDNVFTSTLKEYDFEVIFVNDGSHDESLEILVNLFESDSAKVRILNFSQNFGQLSAIVAGFREVRGDAVICISADLQDDPELIVNMVHSWENKNRVVICYREEREDSATARFFSKIFYSIMKKLYSKMPKGGFDYLLLDSKPLDIFNSFSNNIRFFQGDILSLGFKVDYIPYKRKARKHGESQWSLAKKVKYFLDGILTSTHIPLRMMSVLGFLTSLFGFFYSLVIFYLRFADKTPFKGYAVIIVLMLLIGGVIMMMLGVIGEYLWRVYSEVQKKPLYIIEEKIEQSDS